LRHYLAAVPGPAAEMPTAAASVAAIASELVELYLAPSPAPEHPRTVRLQVWALAAQNQQMHPQAWACLFFCSEDPSCVAG